MSKKSILFSAVLALLMSACGTWRPDKLEIATATAIDTRLPAQMEFADFRAEFPNAVLVDGDESTGTWLAQVTQVCFLCRTSRGFRRSEDVYARIVHFEDSRLARIEATGTMQ